MLRAHRWDDTNCSSTALRIIQARTRYNKRISPSSNVASFFAKQELTMRCSKPPRKRPTLELRRLPVDVAAT